MLEKCDLTRTCCLLTNHGMFRVPEGFLGSAEEHADACLLLLDGNRDTLTLAGR